MLAHNNIDDDNMLIEYCKGDGCNFETVSEAVGDYKRRPVATTYSTF
jgi:hypothetical protein